MPSKAKANLEFQTQELTACCEGKAVSLRRSRRDNMRLCMTQVLIALDDLWDTKHAESFRCLDSSTASTLLVTSRIRGVLPMCYEIELTLLSIDESLELLAG